MFSVGLPLSAQQTTSVINACVAASGGLRVIAASELCKSSETAIQWNVAGPQGPAGPQGVPGAGLVEVIDALGQHVGFYLDDARVLREVSGIRVAVFADHEGFSADQGVSALFFKTPDCSGDAYYAYHSNDRSVLREGRVFEGELYFAGEPLESGRSLRSGRQFTGTSQTCSCCRTASGSSSVLWSPCRCRNSCRRSSLGESEHERGENRKRPSPVV